MSDQIRQSYEDASFYDITPYGNINQRARNLDLSAEIHRSSAKQRDFVNVDFTG